MKILFVFREELHIPNHLIRVQIQSLISEGIIIQSSPFYQGGMKGYISLYGKIRKTLKDKSIDLVHAHYGLTCIIAGLASRKPVIASLMGSDINTGFIGKLITCFAHNYLWSATIVKSEKMRRELGFKKLFVIPNGVSLSRFYPVSKEQAFNFTKFTSVKNIMVVSAKPDTTVKNLLLAKSAIEKLNDQDVQLHILSEVPIDSLVYFYNAADTLLLTSLSEGSPNVIKEAMACNCPIVSTDVGDVRWLFGSLEGHYITSYDKEDVKNKLLLALNFGRRTNGRKRLVDLKLDSGSIAKRIINVYESVLK